MTALPPYRLLLISTGLAAVLAAAVFGVKAGPEPLAAVPVVLPPDCPSCDARHARLQDLRQSPRPVTE